MTATSIRDPYAFETLDEWLLYARGWVHCAKSWRKRSLEVILSIVEPLADNPSMIQPSDLLRAVRQAYPFGSRQHHPYKMWLAEVSRLRTALMDVKATWEQYDVIRIADDMVQLAAIAKTEGRVVDANNMLAKAGLLLETEAPDALGRVCPTCGRLRGTRCHEPKPTATDSNQTKLFELSPVYKLSPTYHEVAFKNATAALRYAADFEERIIPHEARILPKTPRTQ